LKKWGIVGKKSYQHNVYICIIKFWSNMKQTVCILLIFFSVLSLQGQYIYYDASVFPVLGKATTQSATRYERLPDSLRTISLPPLRVLGK
jgi:hypothetical protein